MKGSKNVSPYPFKNVASTTTNWYGHEGQILRCVFLWNIILAMLMGVRWSFWPVMCRYFLGWSRGDVIAVIV